MTYIHRMLPCLLLGGTLLTAQAQEAYTDALQRSQKGMGKVTIYQSTALRRLVNNIAELPNTLISSSQKKAKVDTSRREAQQAVPPQTTSNRDIDTILQLRPSQAKIKVMGYRIQIYAGGNSRENKHKAQRLANDVRMTFPELSVYSNFISPRWVCRAGDFRNISQANEYLVRFRAAGFSQSSVVRTTVLVEAY